MDIKIGRHSFNAEILKTISKDKALKSFKSIGKDIIEQAWNEANPKRTKRKSSNKPSK